MLQMNPIRRHVHIISNFLKKFTKSDFRACFPNYNVVFYLGLQGRTESTEGNWIISIIKYDVGYSNLILITKALIKTINNFIKTLLY